MPFTPKFVDLVRNVTTVQGSGPATLGAAMPGYTGLAEAVLTGEQFYYCIQGVDKPAEREVGRGTMQAGGTILREPISGAATSFTGGTKTIALVAAAEWFNRIELGGQAGASAVAVASRTALGAKAIASPEPTILTESGREGLFVFDAANQSAKVAADAAQGIYVAPAAAPTGAAGAWVRKFSGAVNVRWFGAVGDGVTNDGAAFVAALAFLKAQAINGYGYSRGSAELFVPAGVYFLGTTTLDLTHSLTIRGESVGGAAGGSTVLKWTSGTTGIRTQAYNTIGATGFVAPPAPNNGQGMATIRNINLHGGFIVGVESEAHGIHMRVSTNIIDVGIENFPGDGIFARCSAGLGGTAEGNANSSFIDHVYAQNCRNGLYLDAADTNACTIIAFNGNVNRQWGVWDSSFLGNTYVGCHSAGNGCDGTITSGPSAPTGCTYLGNRYFVKRDQDAGASTNAPTGTTASNTWWIYHGVGGVSNGVVAWVSGTVFRAGGAYRADGPSSTNVFTGCYSEGDQGPAQMEPKTLVLGGLYGSIIDGACAVIDAGIGGARVRSNLEVEKLLTVNGASDGTIIDIGRTTGTSGFASTYNLNSDTNAQYLMFKSWTGGIPITDGSVSSFRGSGLLLDGKPDIYLKANAVDIAIVNSSGFDLQAGKVLKVAGAQVVGARGAAVADATDAASAITQLNALLARCRAHGLIAP